MRKRVRCERAITHLDTLERLWRAQRVLRLCRTDCSEHRALREALIVVKAQLALLFAHVFGLLWHHVGWILVHLVNVAARSHAGSGSVGK